MRSGLGDTNTKDGGPELADMTVKRKDSNLLGSAVWRYSNLESLKADA